VQLQAPFVSAATLSVSRSASSLLLRCPLTKCCYGPGTPTATRSSTVAVSECELCARAAQWKVAAAVAS
jgi:hypothetical protein